MDPIANMITIIRNAQAVKKEMARVPYSKINYNLALILKQEGFIHGVEKKDKKNSVPSMTISLKYTEDSKPFIQGFRKISKPGQRLYVNTREIPKIKSDYGQAIISTPQGLLTGRDAKKKKLGGEYIADIW